MSDKLFEANVSDLHEHPILNGFPRLTQDQFDSLVDSIVDRGVLKPLTCIKAPDGRLLIIDGRNRFSAAQRAGLKKVPVLMAPDGTDPLDYAIESAVQGRNLTKSGVVLMLFLKHPDLAQNKNKGGQPKRTGELFSGSQKGDGKIDSFTKIASAYHVPREYFFALSNVRELCRPWPKDADFEWKLIQQWIIDGEMCIARLAPALEGYQMSHPVGRDGAPMEAPGKAPVNLGRGFERTFTYLKNQFERWEDLPKPDRNVLAKMWWDVMDKLPKDLRTDGRE
ncbi:MAG: ParB/RepB/Spo0J family partition protein [Kiritimatiellia bacterium]